MEPDNIIDLQADNSLHNYPAEMLLPAGVEFTREEWVELLFKVRDIHRIMMDLETNVKPALEKIATGGLFSAILGGKRK